MAMYVQRGKHTHTYSQQACLPPFSRTHAPLRPSTGRELCKRSVKSFMLILNCFSWSVSCLRLHGLAWHQWKSGGFTVWASRHSRPLVNKGILHPPTPPPRPSLVPLWIWLACVLVAFFFHYCFEEYAIFSAPCQNTSVSSCVCMCSHKARRLEWSLKLRALRGRRCCASHCVPARVM